MRSKPALISVNVEFEKKIIIIIAQNLAFGQGLCMLTFDLYTQYELFLGCKQRVGMRASGSLQLLFFAFCVPEHCVHAKRKRLNNN